MFNVYINHFNRGGSVVDTEELMFSVPGAEGKFPVQKPIVKCGEDSADQFSFSMECNSPYYDAILPKKTMLRVTFGEGNNPDVIFFGYALPPSTSTVFQTKSVICTGKYVYLNDTYYEGKQEKHRKKITLSDYLDRIITNHNTMAPAKAITKGTVDNSLYPTDSSGNAKKDKYEPTSWSQTSSLLSTMANNYGGHMRIRYSGDTAYLDWYKYYNRDLGDGNRPKVKVTKNILDISSETNMDDIFTRVIPIGDTNTDGKTIYIDGYKYTDKNGTARTYSGKAMPVSFIRDYIYTDQQLTDEFHQASDYQYAESNFGVIYKTMTFSDCNTKAKLFSECCKWLKKSYFGLAPSFTVKAIDMHFQDGTSPRILVGDCVDVTYLIIINGVKTWQTRKLVCKNAQYDLLNPDNNSYTFGFPSDLLEYNRYSQKKSKKKTVSEQTTPKTTPKGTQDEEITWRKIWQMIGTLDGDHDYEGTDAANSFFANGELSGVVEVYDPDEVVDDNGNTIGNNPRAYKDRWFKARIVGKITLSGKSVKWVAFSEERGIFAYTHMSYPDRVGHWYDQKKGYKYQASKTGLSTFETIAEMIEKDTNETYGGATHAAEFKRFGKINGTVKAYDPDNTSPGSQEFDKYVFQAQIVGKFGTAGSIKFVAVSNEYGVFAYSHSAYPDQVQHWYTQGSGMTYDNVNGLITDGTTGSTYMTDDGSPDGNKTALFKPTQLTFPDYDPQKKYAKGAMVTHDGKVWKCKQAITTPEAWNSSHWDEVTNPSKGGAFFGYNATAGTGDNWEIELNTPIAYTDADGNTQVASGVVRASDFSVQEVPSFKTKIGVFDIVIAGKVQAQEISADLATVRRMFSGYMAGITISAETIDTGDTGSVYTNHLYYKRTGMSAIDVMGKIIQTHSFVTTGSSSGVAGKIQLKGYPMNSVAQETLAGVALQFTESNGVITLQGKNSESQSASWVNLANFNMANTAFYENAVAAAKDTGANGVTLSAPKLTLDPGESVTVNGSYTSAVDHQSHTISSTVTITASGSGPIEVPIPEIYYYMQGQSYTTPITLKDTTETLAITSSITIRARYKVSGIGWYDGGNLTINPPNYDPRNLYCSKIEQTYPGSATSFYYFRLEGNYSSFSEGNYYTMYRSNGW